MNWIVYIIIAIVAELLLLVCNKYNLIKSKPLCYIVALAISTIICWVIYDLAFAPS